MSKTQNSFDMKSCRYGQGEDKQNTLRCQLYDEGCKNALTLETSFFAWSNKHRQLVPYNEHNLKKLGRSLIQSLFLASCPQQLCVQQLGLSKTKLRAIIQSLAPSIQKSEFETTLIRDDEESQSQPEADQLPQQEQLLTFEIKKKNLKMVKSEKRTIDKNVTEGSLLRNTLKQIKIKGKTKRKETIDFTSQSQVEIECQDVQTRKRSLHTRGKSQPRSLLSHPGIFSRDRFGGKKSHPPNIQLSFAQDHRTHDIPSSYEIIKREKELIVSEHRQPTRYGNNFLSPIQYRPIQEDRPNPSSQYINYKLYKRRLNTCVNNRRRGGGNITMNGGHIVQPNGELNKLLKTIHHGMMEDNKKDKKLLYDFPLF